MAQSVVWSYERALLELWRRSSYERGLISDPFGSVERAEQGMERTRALLDALDNPQRRPRTVHVAGSKGKGSTSTFIAAAAESAGHLTGLYTSPHVHRFPERIAIGGKPIPDRAFAAVAQQVAEAAVEVEAFRPDLGEVSTFEFITAMAFCAFAQAACDLAVIEVGLGGLYDATNVLAPVVTVLTRIDLEHTAVLGPTHADIAHQKAGILRPGVPAVASPQVKEATETIVREAARIGAPLQIGGRDWRWQGTWRSFAASGPWGNWRDLALGMPGPHQVENACTGLAALQAIATAGIALPEPAIRAGLASARCPARFERIVSGSRVVIFDGAHTPAAAAALVDSWQEDVGPEPATVVLGMGADKDIAAFLDQLRPIIRDLVVTRADSPRAADPARVAAAAAEMGIPAVVSPSVAEAIATALAASAGPLLITGSLFVAGEGRETFGLAAPDRVWRRLNEVESRRTNAANRQ